MTTLIRKLLVLGMVAAVLVLASIYEVVRWLTRLGVPETAADLRDRYLSGTTVAIIVALVFLLRSERRRPWRDHPYRPSDHGPPCYRHRRDWW